MSWAVCIWVGCASCACGSNEGDGGTGAASGSGGNGSTGFLGAATGSGGSNSSASNGSGANGASSASSGGASGANATSAGGDGGETSSSGGPGRQAYGEDFGGGEFHLGPVDWEESEWHNSCAPYPPEIQQIEGDFLAGLELAHNGEGQLCDACVELTAATGKSILARVVTTGVTTPNSIDLSPAAYAALDSGEYPRAMTWHVVKCPDTGNLFYQFQTEANVWWTSLWVRNPRLPIDKVEVRSSNHPSWAELARGSDGTYTDAGGFGEGEFTLRITALDGQIVEDTLSGFEAGDLIESSSNFR